MGDGHAVHQRKETANLSPQRQRQSPPRGGGDVRKADRGGRAGYGCRATGKAPQDFGVGWRGRGGEGAREGGWGGNGDAEAARQGGEGLLKMYENGAQFL